MCRKAAGRRSGGRCLHRASRRGRQLVRESDHLFVYGTLRRMSGHDAHRLVATDAVLVGEGSLRGLLYAADGYPALVASDDAADLVRGEVYRLGGSGQCATASVLARLDEYEGCDPLHPARGLFRRVRAEVALDDGRRVSAWVYLYNRDTTALRRIASGDYCVSSASRRA